ncbi:hypothetical protein ACFL15_00190 [Patescibacteria group bacterium]
MFLVTLKLFNYSMIASTEAKRILGEFGGKGISVEPRKKDSPPSVRISATFKTDDEAGEVTKRLLRADLLQDSSVEIRREGSPEEPEPKIVREFQKAGVSLDAEKSSEGYPKDRNVV